MAKVMKLSLSDIEGSLLTEGRKNKVRKKKKWEKQIAGIVC